jgi:uncharacterized alpha-E superfamily protein
MLSRTVESMYWMGRYIERSDVTAGILDVHLQLMLEEPWITEDRACRSLLSVMGRDAPGDVLLSSSDLLDILAVNRSEQASIAHSLGAARENAKGAREFVSTELWECLNTTRARMPRKVASDKVHEFFAWVRERSALAVGIIESAIRRDEAWQFFTLGRSLERAELTARLLSTRPLTEAGGSSWTTILRSFGAYEAYLHAHRGETSAQSAAEFLLLDRLFPRSILFSIRRAETCLRDIEQQTSIERRTAPGPSDEQTLFGRLGGRLESLSINEILEDLPGQMNNVQATTSSAADAIRQRYFPSGAAQWIGTPS